MFCSNCGKELGAVAHIRNDQLLCEDCFLKLGQGEQTSHAVVLGAPAHDERNQATSTTQTELAPSQEGNVLTRLLMQGESLLWKRSFSKGIIHRYLTFTEFVTNIRAACVDDEKMTLIGYIPLRLAEVIVDKERREYGGTHTGVETHGMYSGVGSGQSTTYGNVNFIANGKIILTFYNVRDPNGLKNLVNASKKSSSETTHMA